MLQRRQSAAQPLAAPQHGNALPWRQRIEIEFQRPVQVSGQGVECLDDLFPASRTPVLILARMSDKSPKLSTTKTTVTQVNAVTCATTATASPGSAPLAIA
jgi:hypothetical protein